MYYLKELISSMAILSSLSLPIEGLSLSPEGMSLKARADPYQNRILDTGSTFFEEKSGVWQLIE